MTDVQLERLLRPLLEIYAQIETGLLLNICERLVTYQSIGGSLEWYIKKLQESGALNRANMELISQKTGIAIPELTKMFSKVGISAIGGGIPFPAITALIQANIKDGTDILRAINTKALESSQEAYRRTLTKAYTEVSSGTYSYNDAIKRAVVEMARDGITGATYMRGDKEVKYSLESVVRRDVLTKAHQLAVEAQMANMRELGHNLVYVSQHIGARVHLTDEWSDHAGWQGKVYMLDGSSDKYRNLAEATGYGDITGLAGVNCRHNISSYIEGVTRIPKQIDIAENERVYQLTQRQRQLERSVRQAKKLLDVAKTSEATKDDAALIKRLRRQLKSKTDTLDAFVNANPELKRDYARTQVVEEWKV